MEKFKDRVKLGVSPSTTVTTLEASEPMGLDELKEKLGDQLIDKEDDTNEDWITIRWHYEDVLEVRPDLTDYQAREVLQHAKRGHDACMGINWDVLICVADIHFPRKEWNYE